MKLSIIIPVFNERPTLKTLIDKALASPLPEDVSKELVIVDDGSTDGSREIIKSYESCDIVITSFHEQQGGKTAAVKTGFDICTGDYILIQDADLEYDPKHYASLLVPIIDGKAKVVYGSRFLGTINNMEFMNRVANTISNWTINLLSGNKITDFHTCFKLFPKLALKTISIESKNFSFDTELTVKLLKNGYHIYEIPIEYTARPNHEGKKINWGLALETYGVLFKTFFTKQ